MKVKHFDQIPMGLAIGMLSPLLGFVLYGNFWAWHFNRSFRYFVDEIFIGVSTFQSSIVTLSLLINLVPFFLFIRTHRYRSARGVLLAIFIYVPLVVYLRFYNL